MDRDFVGYGSQPPNPKWPDDARLALNFVVAYERDRNREGARGWAAGVQHRDHDAQYGLGRPRLGASA